LVLAINEHRQPDVIDHYEAHGKPMSHYFDVVDAKPYQYVKHWLPHDARAKTLQTGSSILEQAMQHWPGKVAIVPQLSIADGLQAGRWLLQQPMRIHPRCGEGIEALRQYHYEYDEDTKAFGMKPEHDWSSHTADAFRYLACVVKHSELITRKAAPPKPAEQRGHDQTWTLDKLFADNEADKHGRRTSRKKVRRAALWYCAVCRVSGEAKNKLAARNGLILHFVSEAHLTTTEKVETLDLHRRLHEKQRRRI
jgi:hypothetical protein